MINEPDLYWMSLIIFLPTAFAVLLLFIPKGKEDLMRWVALLGTVFTLIASICYFIDFKIMLDNYSNGHGSLLASRAAELYAHPYNQHVANDGLGLLPWIQSFHIDYFVGSDGISMPLVLLTTALCFLAMIASWKIDRYVKGYCILFLLLETGMLGTFLSLDFFLFYIFWEVMLLPMYFLIGVWGGPRREYAAVKFFLYTLFGSVLILIAMLGLYFTNLAPLQGQLERREVVATDRERLAIGKPEHEALYNEAHVYGAERKAIENLMQSQGANGTLNSFSLPVLQIAGRESARIESERSQGVDTGGAEPVFPRAFQITMFVLLFIGFAIKVPVFPFHTWLPDAHVEAPTAISMILAGVLLKMGGYGILRIAYPICPTAAEALAWYVSLFGIINIVYGAFAAMAQKDFKRLVAYSSVSHMGYVILGIAVWSAPGSAQYWSWGMNGAMFQMIAHGITSAGMFFLVGVIYDRAHHRNLENFRGLFEPMPLYGGISAVIFFAAMGLPGMCGFVGEFMVVLATWNYSPVFAILAALTVVLTAAYILWTIQRVFFGQNPAYKTYPDINLRELLCITPLIVFSILLGVLPGLLLSWMQPSVTGLVNALARVGS